MWKEGETPIAKLRTWQKPLSDHIWYAGHCDFSSGSSMVMIQDGVGQEGSIEED